MDDILFRGPHYSFFLKKSFATLLYYANCCMTQAYIIIICLTCSTIIRKNTEGPCTTWTQIVWTRWFSSSSVIQINKLLDTPKNSSEIRGVYLIKKIYREKFFISSNIGFLTVDARWSLSKWNNANVETFYQVISSGINLSHLMSSMRFYSS